MTPVVLEAPPLVRERRIAFPVVIYREVGSGYRPGRGLGLSVVLHNVFLLLIVVFSGRAAFVHSHRVVVQPLREPSQESVVYLPVLGGGNEGSGQAGGGSDDASKVSDGLRAKSRRGFAYRGPQPTVSNPPRASLGTQTILQPSIENLPLLRRDLPLPNIMNIAPPESRPEQKPLVVKSERLAIRTTPERPLEAPKITLPLDAVSSLPRLSASEPALPQKPVPRAPEVSDVRGTARPQKELLVLNAIPAPPQVIAKIPRAEARSLFAIAPAEATIIAEPAAGAKTGTPSSSATGSGSRTDISKGDALAEIASGGDVKSRAEGSGIGDGGRYGSGRGSGLNPTVVSNGTGRGASSGSGTGSGDATSLGSGAGAGSAPGGGGFPGIAIQGGQYGNNTANLHPSSNPRRQTSYNMTIVSTAASGGGLPDLGVFENEKVYTVYLDMKANDEDPAPSWILQYAVLQPQADASDPRVSSQKIVGIPTPPYVMLKAVPGLRPDLLRRSAHTLIVAFAVMNTGGKLEQISVRQSPDSELIAPLVEALAGWMFQPAEINGKPVALKILLGIRLPPNH